MNKKFSLIAIIVFLALLSLQFNNCESVDNPIYIASTTTPTTHPNNEAPQYPLPPEPNQTPREIDPNPDPDPEGNPNDHDPPPPPGEDACDNYNFVDDQINRLREYGDPNDSWRWGYYCPIGEDCINESDQISTVHVAWYKGTNGLDRQRSSNINVYEILNNCDSNPQFTWNLQSNLQGAWIYNRYGSSPPPLPPPPSTNNDDTTKTGGGFSGGGPGGGSPGGGPGGTTTLSSETPLGQCSVPNRLSIVRKVARDHPSLLRNSNNCIKPARNGNYDFLEKVLVELRKTDTRWGYYHRTQHNLNYASYDAIAYYCGSGNGNRSSDLRFVDIISSSCQFQWDDTSHERHKGRANPAKGYWKYPRTGSGGSSSGGSVSVGNSDFSDFDFSKVTWLHHNVSRWSETSRITSVQVKSGGQICIDYTERGRWPAGNPLKKGQLVGNPWVFVKISGRYYAATYEWLRPGQRCKFGHENTRPLSKVYNSAWRGHIKVSPLNRWIPKPGEIVGFMISGLARNSVRNVLKRTNVQFYRLPAADGTGGATLGSYSSSGGLSGETGGSSSGYSTCNSLSKNKPARMQHVVQRLKKENKEAYEAVAVWDSSKREMKYTNDHRFLDLVVNELHRIDDRFGYNCVRGDCSRISADALAYYRGGGTPNNSEDVIIIDFLRGVAGRNLPEPAWTDVTNETCEKGSIGRWKYPRIGSASPGGGAVSGCGQCGSDTQDPCSSGTYNQHPPDSATEYLWTCRNEPHERLAKCNNKREVPCSASKSSNSPPKAVICGKCGDTKHSCATGDKHPHPGDTYTHYRWTCRNDPHEEISSCNGRREVGCAKRKRGPARPVRGRCNEAINNGCFDGVPNDAAYPDNDMFYQWRCDGIDGGANSRECKKATPTAGGGGTRSAQRRTSGPSGQCRNSRRNECLSGSPTVLSGTATHHKWKCGADFCSIRKVSYRHAGRCDNSLKYGCSAGSLKQLPETDTHYKWKCKGIATRSVSCSKRK